MKIEIWSDIMCPFCYIGKKHLEKAIEQLSFKNDLKVIWKSYQLDPNLTFEPLAMSKEEYLINRGYDVDRINQMFEQLKVMGTPLGIDFRQDISILVNSRRAHALIHYAASFEKASEAKEALLLAHFTEAKNIAEESVLKSIALELGLNSEEAWNYIINGKADSLIVEDLMQAQQLGIQGVPFFLFNEQYAASGAQPIEQLKAWITQAYEEQKPQIQILNQDLEEGLGNCGAEGCTV